jgi:predicted dehydrogenase
VGLIGADRVVCCDPREEQLALMASRHPGIHAVRDPREVWSDASVEAVAIATDVATHAPLALEAIAAGKHLFVEKPLSLRAADAERVCAAAEAAGLVLTVDHLLLRDPAIETALALAGEGALGDVRHMYSRRTNLGVVRTVENALWSLGPHDIAVMLRLFGAAPERVTAHGTSIVQDSVEDIVFVALAFPGGRTGHLHLSWLDPAKVRQVTMIGTAAMAVVDDAATARLRILDRSAGIGEHGLPVVRDGGERAVEIDGASPLTRMCRGFLDCIDGGPNPSDGRLGLEVVRVLEAAQASLDAARAGDAS